MNEGKIRVLLTKMGLDYHNRGVKVIARALRDAGIEVIYTGLFQTPEAVAAAAVQEDVDIIGISIHSGAHLTLIPKVIRLLNEEKGSIPIIVGGIIPESDVPELKRIGVTEVFGPGTRLQTICDYVRQISAERHQ